MATTTTNLGLIKPAYEDSADVSKFNQNMDTLDTKMGSFSGSVADALSNHSTAIQKRNVLVITIPSFSSLPQTVANTNIEADMVCVHAVLGNIFAQVGSLTVTTAAGSVTLSGNINRETNATLYLMKSR